MKLRFVAPLFALAVLACSLQATAQVRITGGIAGTVVDAADAVVPGATVQLKDDATGATRDRVTNQAGPPPKNSRPVVSPSGGLGAPRCTRATRSCSRRSAYVS